MYNIKKTKTKSLFSGASAAKYRQISNKHQLHKDLRISHFSSIKSKQLLGVSHRFFKTAAVKSASSIYTVHPILWYFEFSTSILLWHSCQQCMNSMASEESNSDVWAHLPVLFNTAVSPRPCKNSQVYKNQRSLRHLHDNTNVTWTAVLVSGSAKMTFILKR